MRRLQCDEIWAFVYGKDKNLSLEQVQAGGGSVWTWTAIDADTKLIVSYMLGDRGAATAQSFMRDVAGRIANRIQLTTDGHRVYAEAVEGAFGADIDYAMLVKIYGASNDNPESRYSPQLALDAAPEFSQENPIPITSQLRSWSAAIFRCGWECVGSHGSRMLSVRNWRTTGTRLRCTSCTTTFAEFTRV